MDGWDEINCDMLEFNECNENEFRCSNGLCIPDAYFLDGKIFNFIINFKGLSTTYTLTKEHRQISDAYPVHIIRRFWSYKLLKLTPTYKNVFHYEDLSFSL